MARKNPTACFDLQRSLQFHRRSLLQAGGVACLAPWLGQRLLAETLGSNDPSTIAQSPRAKACIFLFMWGGPSQLETFDLKPNAPAEIRGDFRPIATSLPGFQIGEHFTRLSRMADRLVVVRSLNHTDPAHLSSGHATLTGQLAPAINSDAAPPSDKDSPHLGSLFSKLRPAALGLPSFVAMPWKAFHPAAPGGEAPGQHGGWLGKAHDGMLLTGDPNQPAWQPNGLTLPNDIGLGRLESRTELLKLLDQQRHHESVMKKGEELNALQSTAYEMLHSSKVRDAFDIQQESSFMRERYGRNIHGQSVLLARRLVERGVPFVSVNWHNDGRNFWDTHGDNFNRLKNDLIPPADMALTSLLEDLEQRGMLDETLVVWVGEFGRKPQITKNNAGREHWPFCYSGLMAGGGLKKGLVYGSSDAHAAYPVEQPVSPQDFASTILHAMGLSPSMILHDRESRPRTLGAGKVIHELFA